MNTINKLIFLLLILMISCSHQHENTTTDILASEDSTSNLLDALNNTTSAKQTISFEDFITDTIGKIPEVIKQDRYIDSFSKHKHGIAMIVEKPEDNTEYYARVGYDGPERFETYYHFYVDSVTRKITVDDIISGERLTLEEWQKQEKAK
ncbi:MAG: hypothetical protein U0U67_04475 [Chitinophagales bacterium]